MLGNRGYYSSNAKVYEGYRGIRKLQSYILNILLVEFGKVQPFINVNNYALDNDQNLDNAGNFTANNDQPGLNWIEPIIPASEGYTAEEVLQPNDFTEPDYPSGEDVVPS